ncbi:AAA family ATPase [Spirosoma aerolatum]|uniref:AAA family ATPase n=1 Tax=Spirosoma aerolatum TaxID=1211326 RepID=UPI0009AEBB9B|nr:AAA family ATPase [Spirosoma aerolatum]
MQIKRLVIENFKSIERIELIEPNPFTVFVGPNGSGKSNIFEALEFVQTRVNADTAVSLFGGQDKLRRRQSPDGIFKFEFEAEELLYRRTSLTGNSDILDMGNHGWEPIRRVKDLAINYDYLQFDSFSRLFIKNGTLVKLRLNDNKKLALDASNLELVLKRILSDKLLKDEIFEWLELFVPGFKAVEVDDRDELHWFEDSVPNYFTKDLISDGTYNILALLTAVYQSDKPQFLCIEEPENGLHPDVIKEFVNLCRYACEQKDHFIWLNTHSQTLASQLTADEIIVVDKVEGATQTKQFKGHDFHGLRMDEAWLMNALGGGLPW